jgi:hypothetical protein
MTSTFLRLDLATASPSPILINVEHIISIHPNWPHGCTIVTTDDVSLHVRPSLDELQQQMIASGGRITIKWIGQVVDEHGVDAPRSDWEASNTHYSSDHGIDEVYEAARADLLP